MEPVFKIFKIIKIFKPDDDTYSCTVHKSIVAGLGKL